MSKFALGEVVMIRNELSKITQKSVEEKLPAFLAFKFAKLYKEVDVHFIDFDKCRTELVQKYGKPDPENKDLFIVDKDNVVAFNDEISKLLTTEIEFVSSVSFKSTDFDGTKIDVVEASALLPFVKEEE